MKLSTSIFSALFLSLFMVGCAFPRTLARWPASPPKSAILATSGVTIRAPGGSFKMTTGEPVMPPMVHDVTIYERKRGSTWIGDRTGAGISPEVAIGADFWDLTSIQDKIIEVEIDVEGLEKPLIGRMLFLTVFEDSTESSPRRMWRVQIPSNHIDGAKQGFVQTIYQPYRDSTEEWCSWVLSFSTVPF